MSLITLAANLSLLVALATPPTVLEQVLQLPVTYQGSLKVGSHNVPTVVHYDAAINTLYIVVVQETVWGYKPIYVYKVPLDTLEAEEVWADESVSV